MKKRKTKAGKKLLSLLLTAAMFVTVQTFPAAGAVSEAAPAPSQDAQESSADLAEAVTEAEGPSNPVHHCTKQNDGTDYTGWSYAYFGCYPQTEVAGDDLTYLIILNNNTNKHT